MKFKDLFDKEFLYESKKEDKKTTKIFYEFDINIKKKEEQIDNQPTSAPTDNMAMPPVDNTVAPDVGAQPVDIPPMPPVDNTVTPAPDIGAQPVDIPPLPMASVVTEDDNDNDNDKGDNEDDVSINDDNNIIRKLKGEMLLEKDDVDNIQTIEDLITTLTENKVDGANVLDEFTSDILQVMANPTTQMQLKDKIDVESKIFAQILYGKKPEDSVGVRFIKRKGSELITTSMMVDNKIINAQYKKETLDKRITDYRNDEFEEK